MRRKRNKYLVRFFPFLLLFLLPFSGCGTEGKTEEEHTAGVFAMGTYMTLTAYGEPAEEALTLSEDRIKELESLWSVTDENSDIYKLNQSDGEPTEIHEETAEILRFALDMADQTKGALDPTISPIVTTWGFISGEYHIPAEDELTDLLQNIGYDKVIWC